MKKFLLSLCAVAIMAVVSLVSVRGQEKTAQPQPPVMTKALASEISTLVLDLRDNTKWEQASKTLEFKHGVNALAPIMTVKFLSADNEVVQGRCNTLITRIERNLIDRPSGTSKLPPSE